MPEAQQGGKQAAEVSQMENVKDVLLIGFQTLVGLIGAILYTFFAAILELRPRCFKRNDITGQVALVTGGGSGLGRLLCLRLARKGATVITWDVNTAGNVDTVKLLEGEGFSCRADTVDLCNKEAIYAAADRLKGEGIKVDILVNNAGIVTGRNFLDSPDHFVERTFAVNIMSHFWTTKAFLPAMLSSNRGHVVTVASMAGKIGVNKLTDYCASKFAAVGFDESLRVELMVNENSGVHTTLVCPYYINTGMFHGVKSKLIPILEPEYVADEMLDAILIRWKELVLPSYSNVFVMLKLLLNFDAQKKLFYITGCHNSLENFQHSKSATVEITRSTPSG